MQSQLFSANIDEHVRLIRSLNADVENRIYTRMTEQLRQHSSYKLQQLWENLQSVKNKGGSI